MVYSPQIMMRDQPFTLAGVRVFFRSRAGATALEFALVALPFFLIVFAIVEFSRVVWTKSAMHYAVEAAARCAVVDTRCATQEAVQQYAFEQMLAPNVPASSFTLTSCSNNNGKKVSATVQFAFLVDKLMPAPLTLTAESCRPL